MVDKGSNAVNLKLKQLPPSPIPYEKEEDNSNPLVFTEAAYARIQRDKQRVLERQQQEEEDKEEQERNDDI